MYLDRIQQIPRNEYKNTNNTPTSTRDDAGDEAG